MLVLYVVTAVITRSRHSLVCFFAFLIVLMLQLTYSEEVTQNEIYTSFLFFMALYLTIAYYQLKRSLILPAVACSAIALYSFVYALDTIVNYETYTWLWHNHESIIFILHIALMCVSIPKFNTTLAGCWHNSFRVLTNMLHIQPYRHCIKGTQGKEGLK
jgi:hypothetical protein